MLIYEKDNKLNINFENSVNESPDLQIGKSGDKTEVLIDGQPGGSGGSALVVNIVRGQDNDVILDKTAKEIFDAFPNTVVTNSEVQSGIEYKGSIQSTMYQNLDDSTVYMFLVSIGEAPTPIVFVAEHDNDFPKKYNQ